MSAKVLKFFKSDGKEFFTKKPSQKLGKKNKGRNMKLKVN